MQGPLNQMDGTLWRFYGLATIPKIVPVFVVVPILSEYGPRFQNGDKFFRSDSDIFHIYYIPD